MQNPGFFLGSPIVLNMSSYVGKDVHKYSEHVEGALFGPHRLVHRDRRPRPFALSKMSGSRWPTAQARAEATPADQRPCEVSGRGTTRQARTRCIS
mmetsp:Transcript_19992/g.50859  ORF Transcript_19992/g.50859 Transcript_19992/m.50859 type:complete len:96 (+) Transcript_19992:496-783(+)